MQVVDLIISILTPLSVCVEVRTTIESYNGNNFSPPRLCSVRLGVLYVMKGFHCATILIQGTSFGPSLNLSVQLCQMVDPTYLIFRPSAVKHRFVLYHPDLDGSRTSS